MSWATIRDGMKTRLNTISGLAAFDVAPNTTADKDTAFVTYGDPLVTDSGHGGKVDVSVRVVVRCTRATISDSQDALDAYIWPAGSSSIIAAVLTDRTLGGAADTTRFEFVTDVGVMENTTTTMQASIIFRVKAAA